MVNKVILIGNVGVDPNYKEFEGGGAVCNITLATTKRGFKGADGKDVKPTTEWHNITFRNNLAKAANKYVKKGDRLYIEGELHNRQYEKQGIRHNVTEVIVKSYIQLNPKAKEGAMAEDVDDILAGLF